MCSSRSCFRLTALGACLAFAAGPSLSQQDKWYPSKWGQNDEIGSACVQNLGGKPTVVLPAASAEHKPVFPMPGWGKVEKA